MKQIDICLILFVLIFAVSSKAAAQEIEYKLRKAVTTQDPSPFDSKYSSFSITNSPAINIKGEVVFVGAVEGRDSIPSIFLSSSTNPKVIATIGEAAPSGGKFATFLSPLINDNGQVCFLANLDDGVQAIFLNTGSSTRRIVATGEITPEGDTYSKLLAFAFNDNGDVAFVAALAESNGEAVYLRAGEQTKKIVGTGDPLPEGGNFRDVSYIVSVSINNKQEVSFGVPKPWNV